MPVEPSYPGVYIQEIPSGVHTIVGVPTSITAFIGRTQKGIVNEPFLVTSFADFERAFGGLHLNYPLSFSVQDFFMNGGSRALITRLYRAESTVGDAATIPPESEDGDGDDSTPITTLPGAAEDEFEGYARLAEPLTLRASSPGRWGNQLRIIIDHEGITKEVVDRYSDPDADLDTNDFFNLKLRLGKDSVQEEYFRAISLHKAAASRRLDHVLENQSSLARFHGSLNASEDDRPDATGSSELPRFSRGADSQPLTANSYTGNAEGMTGLQALKKTDIFNLLCIPPDKVEEDIHPSVWQAAMRLCAEQRAMLLVDPPISWSGNPSEATQRAATGLSSLGLSGPEARNAAVYFPRILKPNPLFDNRIEAFAPSGAIAGIMARTDASRGVWKAPAGIEATVAGISGVESKLNDSHSGRLNPLGINCLRAFPQVGNVVWGARTLRGSDALGDDYKYVPVRRIALYIEESLYRGTQWVVFEPNDEPLWSQIRLNIGAFMHDLFRQGAFQGSSPKDAYFVQCDATTTTQSDINKGIVNILVGFAPLKPAEFVIIKFQQLAGQVSS